MSDFWTRRRAGVDAERVAAEEEAAVFARAEREASLADRSDAEVLTELGLRDPDEMVAGDDFSAFLGEAVPARLRMRALRRLWRVNPVLANVDGLVDYGQDFTDAATVMEGMQTAYQVGKGMARHVQVLAQKASEVAAEDADVGVETDETEAPDMTEPEVAVARAPAVDDRAAIPDDEVEPVVAAASRRMRFSFREEEA
ncbi:MAG: DUF3306 domain-containing protein [Pseudomonadota bacterium]